MTNVGSLPVGEGGRVGRQLDEHHLAPRQGLADGEQDGPVVLLGAEDAGAGTHRGKHHAALVEKALYGVTRRLRLSAVREL